MNVNIIKKFLHIFFNDGLDIKVRIFNFTILTGALAGIMMACLAAFTKESAAVVALNFSISILSLFMLLIAKKTRQYRICIWISVVVVFFAAFPLLFFYCGGHRSGAAYIFVLAIILTALMLNEIERIFVVLAEAILYVICLIYAFYRPDITAVLLDESSYILASVVNFCSISALLLLVLKMRSYMYNIRQDQILELNRELLARNETLAQYDVMKSDFLATVAHEINTPLAIIAASSSDTIDLLKETPLKIDEITENQMLIDRRVKLIDSILLDLMDTVAIENGRLSLNRELINLSVFLKSVCDAQYTKLGANGNLLNYDLQAGLPHVWLDPMRIEQVMTNLLSNALRHTQDGIIIVKLERSMEGGQVVSVIDNGEGMDEEMAKIVLKQYVSTKADYWRHGIGLYICRQIITAHGGDIKIDSDRSRGTTISFTLSEEP